MSVEWVAGPIPVDSVGGPSRGGHRFDGLGHERPVRRRVAAARRPEQDDHRDPHDRSVGCPGDGERVHDSLQGVQLHGGPPVLRLSVIHGLCGPARRASFSHEGRFHGQGHAPPERHAVPVPDWLAEEFQAREDRIGGARRFAAINAGVPTDSSFQSLEFLKRRRLALEPDLLLIYHEVETTTRRSRCRTRATTSSACCSPTRVSTRCATPGCT
jgi:hypothetical protein